MPSILFSKAVSRGCNFFPGCFVFKSVYKSCALVANLLPGVLLKLDIVYAIKIHVEVS